MKHCTSLFSVLIFSMSLYAQTAEVEKLTATPEMKLIMREGIGIGPATIVVDELEGSVLISERVYDRALIVHILNDRMRSEEVTFDPADVPVFYPLGTCLLGSSFINLQILKDGKQVLFVRESNIFSGGIAFVLKKGTDYVSFFVNAVGALGAADTSGKVYTSQEALTVLKAIDPEKFERSRKRANELGLEAQFLSGKALVWGDTYYDTPERLEKYWGHWIYPSNADQIQYDMHGIGYQVVFSTGSNDGSAVWIIDGDSNLVKKIVFGQYSRVLSTYERGRIYTTSVYVGFGGNIYFYVAGEDFTEIFRIRRTWGKPDFYAMAVNGYTDDGYGKYVKEVLSGLSKEELRLLRNHLFALYGYAFQSKDLAGYFDKQVWYLPKAEATTGGIESALLAERRALLDLVKMEESKR